MIVTYQIEAKLVNVLRRHTQLLQNRLDLFVIDCATSVEIMSREEIFQFLLTQVWFRFSHFELIAGRWQQESRSRQASNGNTTKAENFKCVIHAQDANWDTRGMFTFPFASCVEHFRDVFPNNRAERMRI